MMSVGVAIITYKDKNRLQKVLTPVLNSPLKPRVVVFNSSSNDGTVELAKELGAETLVIPRNEMNHGWTRERCRRFLGTDIFVAITGDAVLEDENVLEKLVKPIMEGKASIAYARQVPNDQANIISRFGRNFNYPEQSNIRSLEDAKKYGVYTAFASNACCAWSQRALDEVGGFRWVLSGEDAVASSMLLKKGHKIAYVAEARVIHSHNYTPKVEFIRHFDTGMYRKQWGSVLDLGGGSDEKRGAGYAKGLLSYVWKNEPKMFFTAFLQLAMGWLGYKVGWFCYHKMSTKFYMKISPADFFWFSVGYKAGMWTEPIDSPKLIFQG
jgi:rhamnosyltransferase